VPDEVHEETGAVPCFDLQLHEDCRPSSCRKSERFVQKMDMNILWQHKGQVSTFNKNAKTRGSGLET